MQDKLIEKEEEKLSLLKEQKKRIFTTNVYLSGS